jgi:hypothetical protein
MRTTRAEPEDHLWSAVHSLGNAAVKHTGSRLAYKPKNVIHFLNSLYRPDDEPDKGRNIVVNAKYIYTW